MPISGYDPDDLEQTLREGLESRGPEAFLTDEQQRRVDEGESLLDVLDTDEIERLLNDTSYRPDR